VTAKLNNALIDQLKQLAGSGGWLEEPDDLAPYLTEWRGLYTGRTPLMLQPTSTQQVAAILALCNEHQIGVVPQGGNTGLAGGAIPGLDDRDEVLLSLRRMRSVRNTDADNFTVTVEAGCILQDVQSHAANFGLLFPLSLAAEGSCQIGGNISTNAGGTNVLRYGNTRDLVLGLEVVLPDGSVLSDLTGLRKDNTGYALRQLFIGAEGTLGVITAATLKLFPAPASSATALVAVADPAAAVKLYGHARAAIGDEMVAFELIPRIALDMVLEHIPNTREPIDTAYPWYVLIELANARAQEVTEDQLTEFLGDCMERGSVTDGIVASSAAQANELWNLRHAISEAQKEAGGSIKHDISVPVSRMPEFLSAADKAVQEILQGARPVPFGHLGDGNLHYNISQPVGMDKQAFVDMWSVFNERIHGLAVEFDGSFSAEHGIGALKAGELARLKDPVALKAMQAVKQSLDPNGIMNPGKVLL
jgi:FAD/FMN-containing dehydrogenase